MPVIRHAEAGVMARDAIVLDLGDLSRQGEALRAEAKRRADAILVEARAERERILTGVTEEARKAGYDAGYADGMARGRADGAAAAMQEHRERLSELDAAWSKSLEAHEAARESLLMMAHRDVLRLTAVIAEKVVKRAVELDASVVTRQMAAALSLLGRPTRVTIALHPDDEHAAREALPSLLSRLVNAKHADLVLEESFSRGSCIVRGDRGGEIDATIDTQLDRLVEALLPDGRDGMALTPRSQSIVCDPTGEVGDESRAEGT